MDNTIPPIIYDLITPHNKLSVAIKKAEIVKSITTKVTPHLNIIETHMNVDLLIFIGNVIFNIVNGSKSFDEIELLEETYKILFPNIAPVDLQLLKNQYDTLKEENVIRKIPISKKIFYYIKKYVIPFLLN